jgi:hypothetical protein
MNGNFALNILKHKFTIIKPSNTSAIYFSFVEVYAEIGSANKLSRFHGVSNFIVKYKTPCPIGFTIAFGLIARGQSNNNQKGENYISNHACKIVKIGFVLILLVVIILRHYASGV